MFSYTSNFFDDEEPGIEESKILRLTSIFNNKNHLEFLLNKEKRFFKFSSTSLEFYIDIPGKTDDSLFKAYFKFKQIMFQKMILQQKSLKV